MCMYNMYCMHITHVICMYITHTHIYVKIMNREAMSKMRQVLSTKENIKYNN